MNFTEIYENNKILIISGVVLIVGFIIYRYYYSRYAYSRATRTEKALKKTCMTPEMQKKIADDISKKLAEIKGCDCSDACGIKDKKAVTETTSKATNEKPMKVGDTVVEAFGSW